MDALRVYDSDSDSQDSDQETTQSLKRKKYDEIEEKLPVKKHIGLPSAHSLLAETTPTARVIESK